MKKHWILFTICLILAGSSLPVGEVAAGSNFYATPSGTGTACSLAEPCKMQTAVSLASTGDHVYLRSGTYVATSSGDRQVLDIKGDLWLMGGCTWTGIADFDCSPSTTPSILDGENERRVITIEGKTSEVNLYGLMIVYGNADGVNPSLCSTKGGTPVLGCGGGVYANGIQSLIIGDVYFDSNVSSWQPTTSGTSLGGALYAYDVEFIDIYNSFFLGNNTGVLGPGFGGAIFIEGDLVATEVIISDNIFRQNNVSESTFSRGGAILITHTGYCEVFENTFTENNNLIRKIDGAAVYFHEMTSSTYTFANNILTGNFGLTIFHSFTTAARVTFNTIERNVFHSNTGTSILHLEGRDNHFIRNNFISYDASSRALRSDQNNIYLKGISPDDILAYIYYNSIASGADAIAADANVTAYIKNNIIASSQNGIHIFGADGFTSIDSNLFFDNDSNGSVGINAVFGDPKFVDMEAGDLHITKGSAAIDQLAVGLGITSDIDNLNIRPFGSSITPYDIGADEWDLVNEVYLPLIFR